MSSNPKIVKARRKLSFKKKLFFSSIVCVLLLITLEGASRYFFVLGGSYKAGVDLAESDQKAIAASGRGKDSARENLHPYIGWTYNPDVDPGTDVKGERIPVNRLGFVDNHDSIQKRSSDRILIGIFGGSLAQDFNNNTSDLLIDLLQGQEPFAGKEIVVIRLAMAGFKQPQQMLLLSYLYSLGAEFDYVVNLDGFNEGVLPIAGNLDFHVNYSYPFGWDKRLYDVVDPRQTDQTFKLLQLRSRRQTIAKNALNSKLRFTAIRNMVWKIQDWNVRRSIDKLAMDSMQFRAEKGRGFATSGPENPSLKNGQLQQHILDLWKHSSLQMHHLCEGNGTIYLHLLQPNQYLPDSKPLNAAEKKIAIAEGHEFQKQVEIIYPRMREQADWFNDHGVNFSDFTQIFFDVEETAYSDWCCHINELGNSLVAEAMAERLMELAVKNK